MKIKKTPTKKHNLTDKDTLFKQLVGQVKPMVQDTIHSVINSGKPKTLLKNKCSDKMIFNQHAEFYFSDQYEPQLPTHGAMKYVRAGVSHYESKNLRRGDYLPEFILDLHGLTQRQAKQEISALLYASKKEHIHCVCIVHGIGSRVLKTKVPHWLVQHPDVMAFHQAPLTWGGDGALLVLLEVKDK